MAEAVKSLETAYAWLDERMAGREWAVGDSFSLADCAAAPALFYDRGYAWMMTSPQVQNYNTVNDGWVLFDKIWLKTH